MKNEVYEASTALQAKLSNLLGKHNVLSISESQLQPNALHVRLRRKPGCDVKIPETFQGFQVSTSVVSNRPEAASWLRWIK
jgi:hypothetical protein